MGVLGKALGGLIGKGLGTLAGNSLGQYTGIGGDRGGAIGEEIGSNVLGDLIPFKKGGRVKKTGPILAHKGEFILPKGVKPTKAQVQAVAKRHRRKHCSKSMLPKRKRVSKKK